MTWWTGSVHLGGALSLAVLVLPVRRWCGEGEWGEGTIQWWLGEDTIPK